MTEREIASKYRETLKKLERLEIYRGWSEIIGWWIGLIIGIAFLSIPIYICYLVIMALRKYLGY